MKLMLRILTVALAMMLGANVPAQTRVFTTYMGAYSASATYNVNDIIISGGVTYISLIAGNLGNSPASNPTDWQVIGGSSSGGGSSISWTGAWSSSTAYAVNNAVSYNGSSYIATAANSNQVPTNTSYWALIAAGSEGTGCGTGNCVVTAPTLSQTITQPANTNFNVVTSGTGNLESNGNPVLALPAAPAAGQAPVWNGSSYTAQPVMQVDARPTLVQSTGKTGTVPAGGSTTVLSVAPGNAGTITFFHMTARGAPSLSALESTILNFACDGGLVSVPIGTFLLAQDAPVAFDLDQIDLPIGVTGAGVGDMIFNRRLHVNFTNGCTVTLVNGSSTAALAIWVDVTYKTGLNTTDPPNMAHWNAISTEYPAIPVSQTSYNDAQEYILPFNTYVGGGQLESVTQFVSAPTGYGYLEGTPTVFADSNLAVYANGGEDFFSCGFYCEGGSYSVRTNRAGLLIGTTGLSAPTNTYDSLGYRFFTTTPSDNVTFTNSLAVGVSNGPGGVGPGIIDLQGLVTYFTTAPNVSQVQYSPAPGTSYAPGQAVTLTEPTSGASICYTTNGTAPAVTPNGSCGSGSTTYTAPIALTTAPIMLTAVGALSGYNSSVPFPIGLYSLPGIAYTGNNCSNFTSAAGSTSITCSLTVANTGDTAVLNLAAQGYTSTSASCGTASLVRSTQFNADANGTMYSYVIDVPNASAGACTITATIPALAGAFAQIQGLDIARANSTSPIDNSSCTASPYCSATGDSTIATGSPITTTNANEMVISFVQSGWGASWTGTGTLYNIPNSVNQTQMASISFAATAGTTITPTFTGSNDFNWVVTTVALTQ